MDEEALQLYWPNLITMKEKGYPINNAMFYVKYINNKPVGHICYKDMGNWYFIGNSYVKKEYRKFGIKLITKVTNLSLSQSLTDSQRGFSAY